MEFQFIEFHRVLKRSLEAFPTATWMNEDGDILDLHYSCLDDIGTLPVAVQTAHKYLPVDEGDIVILNDPYSGGSTLDSLTAITSIQMEASTKRDSFKLLFATRIYFKPVVHITDSVEGEGLRIPPTPLVMRGEMNQDLLEILSQHPMSPPDFKDRILSEVSRIQSHLKVCKASIQLLPFLPNKKFQKSYFKHTKERFLESLSEHPFGTAKADWKLEGDGRLHLQMDLNEKGIVFDFTGTSQSSQWNLTQGASMGACVGALFAILERDVPLNRGIFDAIHLTAPEGSFVNARYPAPVFLGMMDGVTLLANLVIKAFAKLDRRLIYAQPGLSQCAFGIQFENGLYFYDQLETGAPGTPRGKGSDGLNLWRRSFLQPSIEKIERKFPLLIKSYSFRKKSGGSGENPGGNGVSKVIEVTQPAELRWQFSSLLAKPEGISGGKTASGAEIFVQVDEEKEKLADKGKLNIKPDTSVIVNSSGGGGFGEIKDEEES